MCQERAEEIRVPVGPGAERWATRGGCRRVLLVVHNVTAATRLLDVLPLLDGDARLQLLVTCPGSSPFRAGMAALWERIGLPVLPWEQASRTRVDLAVAASYGGQLHALDGPLIVLSHGAGYNKRLATPDTGHRTPDTGHRTPDTGHRTPDTGDGGAPVFGIAPEWLLHEGRPVADVTVLSHPEQLARLRAACPPAAATARLAGDPCFDRLLAARPDRDRFRRALGVADGQRLVVLSSTWNPGSLFGSDLLPTLLARLAAELPADEYQTAAVLHPNLWYGHGPGQVRAWCREAVRAGLVLVDPLDDWRQALLAADCVVGDHGSVTFYAAALGTPVLLGAFPEHQLDPDSPVAALGRTAPALRPDAPLPPQLTAAIEGHDPERHAPVTALLTSAPGESAARLRSLCYELIGLPEPATSPALLGPLPLPAYRPPVRTAPLTALTRLRGAAHGAPPEIEVARFAGPAPASGYAAHDTHTVVAEDCPDPSRLSLASVVVRHGAEDDPRLGPAGAWTAEAAARYPYAALTVFVGGPGRCTVRTGDGRLLVLAAARDARGRADLADPAVYASALYAWLSNGGSVADLGGGMTVRTGTVRHRVTVSPAPLPGPLAPPL
ncbi:hypothetical protein ACTWP5_13300 [Streptomyces sp. 4N509B]|uniref:hypothetical protein n=1 Tax=Streptomyces sp. 4N509B TaxID=3457413 RepID=UPI003FD47032